MKQMLLKVKYFTLLRHLLTYSYGMQAIYNETKRQQNSFWFQSNTTLYFIFILMTCFSQLTIRPFLQNLE